MLPELDNSIVEKMYALMQNGNELLKDGNTPQACKCYEEAWSHLPDPKLSWDSSQLMVSYFAEFYRDACMFKEAESYVEKVFECKPAEGDGGPFYLLGTIYFESGHLVEAKRVFGRALELSGKRPFTGNPKYLKFALSGQDDGAK